MYLDAVEQSISVEKMKNTTFKPNECTITEKGNLDCDTKDGILEVKVNGDKPVNGSITFEEGKIKKATLEYKNDKVIIMNTEGKLQYQKYISISNYQHKHIDGTIGNHEVTFDSNGHGTCSICMEEVLMEGLYDVETNNLILNWDDFLVKSGASVDSSGVFDSADDGWINFNKTGYVDYNLRIVFPKSVKRLERLCFYMKIGPGSGLTNLTEVVIPNTVTSIGDQAFASCKDLTTIEMTESITSIGYSAFRGCKSLKSITIPESVTSIGEHAFSECASLESIIIDENNKIYDSRNNCNAIIKTATNTLIVGCQNTIIPDSVKSIGESAFYGCTSLTSITIPDSITSIGDYAFDSCSGLTSIEIPGSVKSIGEYAFRSCTGLAIVDLGNKVTSIEKGTFIFCTALTTIEIPESVKSIRESAFMDCESLTSIYIPSSVITISASENYTAPFYVCSPTLKIYTGVKAEEIPSGWVNNWNYESKTGTFLSVTYGVTREEYESNYK